MRILYFLVLSFLIGCASFKEKEPVYIHATSKDVVCLYGQLNDYLIPHRWKKFSSREECESSDEYKEILDLKRKNLIGSFFVDKESDPLMCSRSGGYKDGKKRYYSPYDCEYSEEFKELSKKIKKEKEEKRLQKIYTYFKKNPKEEKYKKYVMKKEVEIGMKEEAVFLSFGTPKKISKEVFNKGEKVLYYYKDFVVEIKNGEVVYYKVEVQGS